MTYARIENGEVTEYPVYEGDLRLRFPHVSFPTPFDPPDGYVAVADVPAPKIDHTQNFSEGAPVLLDAGWTRTWVVSAASAEDVAARLAARWNGVRSERNRKLTLSDWTQLADAPLGSADKAGWAAYRQALRDITQQNDPFNVAWPEEPRPAQT